MKSAIKNRLGFPLSNLGETRFFEAFKANPSPHRLLGVFGQQYHYFSIHQIHAFSGVLRLFTPRDRLISAKLAKVVYDELGSGDSSRIHSVLLENFLVELGIDISLLPLPESAVCPGVREYVKALYDAFWGTDRTIALASYCFLENSAVTSYPRLVDLLTETGISAKAIEFFSIHACIEVDHAETAKTLADSMVTSDCDVTKFNSQFHSLN